MIHALPTVYLPRPGDTLEVFCENAHRRARPCQGYVRMNRDGVCLSGVIAYFGSSRAARYLCSWKCVESYAKRVK